MDFAPRHSSHLHILLALGFLGVVEVALATNAANAQPVAPFWRKTTAAPTYAPVWYGNSGPVTREVFYNSGQTPAQNGAALKTIVQGLKAGDHLLIHGGTYSINSYFPVQVVGTPDRPITIEGAPGETVVLTQASTGQNVIEFNQSRYVILKGLVLKGGSKGLRVHTVDHFMLYNSKVYDTASGAISANSGVSSYLYFIDNHVHDTGGNGEAFYLGLDANTHTHDTFVVGNYIHDLNAADVSQGDGVEIKYGSYNVLVKWNYIERTKYPGIVLYGNGKGTTGLNIIEENVVLFSSDVGIQASSEAIIRNNLVITGGTAFSSKPEVTNPRHLSVVNNTFVTNATAAKTSGWGAADAVGLVLANNALHSATGAFLPTSTGNGTVSGNVFVPSLATAFVNLTLDGTGRDAAPKAGSPLIAAATPQYLPAVDLHSRPRITAADSGAVDYQAATPAPTVFIVDNGAAGFLTTGTWTLIPFQAYEGDISYNGGPGGAVETATWNFTGLQPGTYRVSATWRAQYNCATNAFYKISSGGVQVATATINQVPGPNDFVANAATWENLATVTVSAGDTSGATGMLSVQLDTTTANNYVFADAVRVERIGN